MPHFGSGEVTSETKVEVEVRIGPERDPLNSAPAEFTYTIPKGIYQGRHLMLLCLSLRLEEGMGPVSFVAHLPYTDLSFCDSSCVCIEPVDSNCVVHHIDSVM